MPTAELRTEHRALEAQSARMLRIVAAPVADAASVAGLRWQMAHALLTHCAREDALVYDAILASGDHDAIVVAQHYRGEFGALGAAFARYIADWPVDRINREWDGFRSDSQAIMAAVSARIAAEERDLYPRVETKTADRRAA